MSDIDISKIRVGDTVRVRFQSAAMAAMGIAPYEYTTVTHPGIYRGGVYAGSDRIDSPALTIVEHIPARPDWADALAVRDCRGKLWARSGLGESGKNECWSLIDKGLMGGAVIRLEDWHGPATVVLDADGNPPTPEPEPGDDSSWNDSSPEDWQTDTPHNCGPEEGW